MGNFKLQLKRNLLLSESKADALMKLKAQLETVSDGEMVTVRYKDGVNVKTIFGIKAESEVEGTNYTIFDPEAIPADVAKEIEKIVGENPDQSYDTIKEIADALNKINGSGEGSISKVLTDAKAYSDEKISAIDYTDSAVENSFVSTVNQTDGVIAVGRKKIVSDDKSINVATSSDATNISVGVNVDGTTIVVNGETGKLSVASGALVQYQGENAIYVSEEQDGVKKITLTLDPSDKVLKQSASGLKSEINLTWDKSNGLKLIGKDSTEIATIPATDFIKDGMLENVELVELTEGTETNPEGLTDGTYLKFTFNTDGGAKVIYVNVTSLIDIYTAGNGIIVSGKVISAKIKAGENILKVDGNGLYVDTLALDTQISDVKYKSELPDTLTTPSKHGGLAAGTKVSDLKKKTLSQVFDDILFEEIQPTVNNPSCSISLKGSWANNGIYEVNAAAPTSEADFNISFNRGSCTVVGQPQKWRAGTETGREVKLGAAELSEGAKITLGTMTYNLTINHGEGDTLLTSKGNPATNAVPNPLTAGSVKSSCNIFGTYPYFCNGATCSTSAQDSNLPSTPTPNTKLPLQKWTDTLIGAKFASEASTGTRLEFIYPKAKNITKVEFFNTVSGKWEVFGSDKYTTSATEQQTIQGEQVEYMKLTTTGAMSGALQLRFTVANASVLMSDEPDTYNGEFITDEVVNMLAANSMTMPLADTPSLLSSTGNRPSGVAAFAVNFEPGGQAPLDARTLVDAVSDLTASDTYSAKNYFKGLTVTVNDSGNGKPAIYVLNNPDDITNPQSWTKQGGDATDMTLTGYVRSEATGSDLELKTTDTVVGAFGKLEKAIIDNEEVTSEAIDKIANMTGLMNDGEIKFTAPTLSGVFTDATSIMNMLNLIDENWNTIDCGTY